MDLDEVDLLGGVFEPVDDDFDSMMDLADEMGHAVDPDMDAGAQQAFGMEDLELAAELGHALVVRQEITRRYVKGSPLLMDHARSVYLENLKQRQISKLQTEKLKADERESHLQQFCPEIAHAFGMEAQKTKARWKPRSH